MNNKLTNQEKGGWARPGPGTQQEGREHDPFAAGRDAAGNLTAYVVTKKGETRPACDYHPELGDTLVGA